VLDLQEVHACKKAHLHYVLPELQRSLEIHDVHGFRFYLRPYVESRQTQRINQQTYLTTKARFGSEDVDTHGAVPRVPFLPRDDTNAFAVRDRRFDPLGYRPVPLAQLK